MDHSEENASLLNKNKKLVYFDHLRVIAGLAVVLLHVACISSYNFDTRSWGWIISKFYEGITGWAVPIFVMISGALFLSRELDTKKLYTKYIFKLLVSYFAWSTFYVAIVPIVKQLFIEKAQLSFASILGHIIGGEYHMWFLPMIIGLYMTVPILRDLTKSNKTIKYFLTVSFIISFLFPQVVSMSNDFIGGLFATGLNEIEALVKDYVQLRFFIGFPFYFVLGYVLNKTDLSKRQRKYIYFLGAIGFFSTVTLNTFSAWKANTPSETYFDAFRINVLLEVVALHTWFKYKEYKRTKLNAIVSALAKYSFGTYLIHIFIIRLLSDIGMSTLICSPILSVPIIFIVAAVISYAASWMLNKIPVLKNWIV